MVVTSLGTSIPKETAYGQIVDTTKVVTISEKSDSELVNVENLVRTYFADIPIMVQVARCESTFRHTLKDGSVLHGMVDPADTGVMQINKRYHESAATALGLDLNDIYDNMTYARHLYEVQGTQPWNASAPCWINSLAINI